MHLQWLLSGCAIIASALASVEIRAGNGSTSLTPTNPSEYWYSSIKHNGISPVAPNGTTWPVFRNVKSMFGAKGDGKHDDTAALQNAINAGNSYAMRNSNSLGTTGQPAVVYLPKGEYVLTTPLQFFVGMILMGDPIDPPTIKASSNFSGDYMIYAKDPSQGATTNFYVGMKNVIIDSQSFDKDQNLTLVDWSVSQACQLANVRFDMPYDSTGHTGIAMPEGGSALIMEDLHFRGGNVGINLDNQQYHFKSLTFDGCGTGIFVEHLFMAHCQGCNFTSCGVGIDTSSPRDGAMGLGSFIVTDSTASNTGVLVKTAVTNGSWDSIVLENVQVDEPSVTSTVTAGAKTILTGSVGASEAWVIGNSYSPNGPSSGVFRPGTTLPTHRSSSLVDETGAFYRFAPPTYAEYDVDQFINVKDVAGYAVAGDGASDDTASLQAIINEYAGSKILFFPFGIYLVTDTLIFPPGSRVFGEAWSAISATGSKFANPAAPIPMVQVGEQGDVGVAQFSDMLLTVEDVLPGCVLLEVNMAGENPGDVGFWNTHFRVGGAADSRVQTKCGALTTIDAGDCKAAFMLGHFTSTSSAYVDDMWGWTADHDLDGGNGNQYISVGRGFLIESTQPSWLVGFASEHNTLYEVNLHGAANLFAGFQQSETPYWQGVGSAQLAPAPWGDDLLASDPDFSWCATAAGAPNASSSARFASTTAVSSDAEAQCRMSLYQRIRGARDLSLYAGGFWTFFNNNTACSGDCQDDAVRIEDSEGVYYFGLGVNHVRNLVVRDGEDLVTSEDNEGGWSANLAAYLADSET
ncbi:glycoside hydrolase family 55 protein [Xylariaceae sp. FL0016]|nr:glycoside hydrolase family 55 protein [Xylariaceae sp. FL0016]